MTQQLNNLNNDDYSNVFMNEDADHLWATTTNVILCSQQLLIDDSGISQMFQQTQENSFSQIPNSQNLLSSQAYQNWPVSQSRSLSLEIPFQYQLQNQCGNFNNTQDTLSTIDYYSQSQQTQNIAENDTFYENVNLFNLSQQASIERFKALIEANYQTLEKGVIIAKLKTLKNNFREKRLPTTRANKPKEAVPKYYNILRSRRRSSIIYSSTEGLTLSKIRKFSGVNEIKKKKIIFLINRIIEILEDNIYCTVRNIYYQNTKLFKNPISLMGLIKDICSTLDVARIDLNITAAPKGVVFGNLKFMDENNNVVDCKQNLSGTLIPNNTKKIDISTSDAKFILIVEKYTVFYKLINSNIIEKFPLIMITGSGYPDLKTKSFVQKLWLSLKIPIFGLIDGDAYGIEILSTYRYGSFSMAHENYHMVVPEIQWLGIQATDIIEFDLIGIKFNASELKRFSFLKDRAYIRNNPVWYQQIERIEQIGMKVEIESLCNHWANFLLEIYLPYKLRSGGWL